MSIDLSKRWLSRIPTQLELNGINPQKHRCLVGDVFDWLNRLKRRGESFNLVILDPPSTSVGKTKRRWSVKRDYGELVALAAPLVAPGGAMMTSTNYRQMNAYQLAKKVQQDIPTDFVLERVCAPPIDFPAECLEIKNLIWRRRF